MIDSQRAAARAVLAAALCGAGWAMGCQAPDGGSLFRPTSGGVVQGPEGVADREESLGVGLLKPDAGAGPTSPPRMPPPPMRRPAGDPPALGEPDAEAPALGDAGAPARGDRRDAASPNGSVSDDASLPAPLEPEPKLEPEPEPKFEREPEPKFEPEPEPAGCRVGNIAECTPGCFPLELGGVRFVFCELEVTRSEALERCAADGMRLAWIESQEDNQRLVDAIVGLEVELPSNPELLTQIGASDEQREGEWRWVGSSAAPDGYVFWRGGSRRVGGQPVDGTFNGWNDAEPSLIGAAGPEDCAVVSVAGSARRPSGAWHDRSCSEAFPFVCEAP